jgi:hypothetical protein
MEVWILECKIPGEGDTYVTVWESPDAAYKQACAEIQQIIKDEWKLPSTAVSKTEAAEAINQLVADAHYLKAVEYWNNCDLNSDTEGAVFYYSNRRRVKEYLAADEPHVFSADTFGNTVIAMASPDKKDCGDCANCDCDKPYQATVPGATCRKCDKVSPDAYADKADGTFKCWQCKMLGDVFGAD